MDFVLALTLFNLDHDEQVKVKAVESLSDLLQGLDPKLGNQNETCKPQPEGCFNATPATMREMCVEAATENRMSPGNICCKNFKEYKDCVGNCWEERVDWNKLKDHVAQKAVSSLNQSCTLLVCVE